MVLFINGERIVFLNHSSETGGSTGGMLQQDSKDFEKEVRAIFEKYDPSYLSKIDSILKAYAGREEVLLTALKVKYKISEEKQPEEMPSEKIPAASETILQKEIPPVEEKRAPEPEKPKSDDASEEKAEDSEEILQAGKEKKSFRKLIIYGGVIFALLVGIFFLWRYLPQVKSSLSFLKSKTENSEKSVSTLPSEIAEYDSDNNGIITKSEIEAAIDKSFENDDSPEKIQQLIDFFFDQDSGQ